MNAKVWACTSIGTCFASFAAYAIPALQIVALIVSIAAGIKALRSRK
jgi:hypothetical protein